MANPVVTLSYIGNGPTGANQSIADQTSGPKAKTLYAYGTLVASSGTFCTTTAATVNFIDGVQGFGKTVVLSCQSVDAPVTYLGTSNVAFYHTVQAAGQIKVGDSITVAGFTNSANNTTGTVLYVITGAIGISNSSAVAETNPAATIVSNKSSIPAFVNVFVAGNSGDSAGAVAAIGVITPSSLSSTGCTLKYSSLTTTGATVTLGAIIAFSS